MFSKKMNILIILAISTLFPFMASYSQPAEANENLEGQNLFIPIIVAVISAGVSIFSIFRNEANTKISREHEKDLAESLREHEKILAASKQKHDEWQTSITDVRERELDEARREHERKLSEWKAERERELEEAKQADQLLFEQWRIEREGKLLEEKALRDYQYEARKRLYEEFEPLLFQFNELSESALRRILAFVREAKEGNLVPWLSSIDGYYMKNTIYRLLAPLAVFRLMQNRLTLFDLNLDTCIKVQYLLIKALYHTFSNDFKLAKSEPCLPYDPHKIADYETANKSVMLQGIFLGVLRPIS